MLKEEPLFTGVSMHNSSGLPSTPASVNGINSRCHLAFHQTREQQLLNQNAHRVHMLTSINVLNYTLSNTHSCLQYYITSY